MGKILTPLALMTLAACATRPAPQAVAPALPPASLNQVTILDPEATVVATPAPTGETPAVIDVQAALQATPEVKELRSRRYSDDQPEYYVLIHRANQRVREAIRQVVSRRSLGRVMKTGTVVLKPEVHDRAVTDITEEVAWLVGR